jgi:small-conductance mechanosensitive channel
MLRYKLPKMTREFAIRCFAMFCIALWMFWVLLVVLNRFYPEHDHVSACEGRVPPHEPSRPLPRFVVNIIYLSAAVAIPIVAVLCFMFFGLSSYLYVREQICRERRVS